MSMAELEQLAAAYNMHVVNGELTFFSKAEMEQDAQFIDDLVKSVSTTWDDLAKATVKSFDELKAKFAGASTDMLNALAAGFEVISKDAAELAAVATAVSAANDAAGNHKTIADAMSRQLTATTPMNLGSFCNVANCFLDPSYMNCQNVEPFKTVITRIEGNALLKGKADLAYYAKVAAVRIVIMHLAGVVKAARIALDSAPGAAVINAALDAIGTQCKIISAGDVYAQKCALDPIRKTLAIFKTTFTHLKALSFKDLATYARGLKANDIPDFTTSGLIKCIIKEVKANPNLANDKAGELKLEL